MDVWPTYLPWGAMMQELFEKRSTLIAEAEGVLDAAEAESRKLTEDESGKVAGLRSEIDAVNELIEQRATLADARSAHAGVLDKFRKAPEAVEPVAVPEVEATVQERKAPEVEVTPRDPGHYRVDSERSFFMDVVAAQKKGDFEAARRLAEHNDAQRALNNTATEGGEAAVPLYLNDLFEKARVAQAVSANLIGRSALPATGESITVPLQDGDASVARLAQNASLNSLSETDLTTDKVTAPVVEIGGTQDLSNFVVERGSLGAKLDVIAAQHLAELLAADEGHRVLNGAGSGDVDGIRATTGIKSVTYTATTGSLVEIYKKLADLIQQIATGNKVLPSAIVVAPRRFYAWAAELDSENRPLMAPMSVAQNPFAIGGGPGAAEGFTGWAIHGLPIYVDNSIALTSGSGTNEDTVYVCDWQKLHLWSGPVMVETDHSINFKKSGMTVRARRYMAFMAGHRPSACGRIVGTGLATPTF